MSKNRMIKNSSRMFCIIMLLSLFTISLGEGAQLDSNKTKKEMGEKKRYFTLSVFGVLPTGKVSYYPCLPEGEGYYGGGAPYDSSFGFGLTLDYNFTELLRLFFDAGYYNWKKIVAEEGGYSQGIWVHEQTDYMTNRIGPFSMDVYYHMDTTGFRVGGKYAILSGKIQPWVGAGVGLYSWRVDFANKKKSKTYGHDNGTIVGITYLVGIDIKIGKLDNPIIFTLYGDFASPVAKPKIENLFKNGWTWENTAGEHIMGPYRLGLAIGCSL